MAEKYINKDGGDTVFLTKVSGVLVEVLRINNEGTLTAPSLNGPGVIPVGGLFAIMPHIDLVNAWQPPATGVIKDGYMRADGATINAANVTAGSKLALNTVLPNITGERYLRGSTTSGATGGSNTVTLAAANIPQLSGSFASGGQSQNHTHVAGGLFGGDTNSVAGVSDASSTTLRNTGVASNDHTHTTAVTLGSASPTAVNNEPSYISTVWVIRVK